MGKNRHLIAHWLTAIGASLSALCILVANGWMQNPVGMVFNPETARNEMQNFWEIIFSQNAVDKWLHVTSSGFVLASIFVIGVSSWYLLKKRDLQLAKKSILIASVFGFISSVYLVTTGDNSTRTIAEIQPMKFAALEGMYKGTEGAGLVAIGIFSSSETDPENENLKDFTLKIEIPKVLSFMAFLDWNAFIPGINDLIYGNEKYGLMPAAEKIERGKVAISKLHAYKEAKKAEDEALTSALLAEFTSDEFQEGYFKYFGYGYFKDVNDLIPNIPLTFYSFHLMVGLGLLFVLLFALSFFFVVKGTLENKRWFLRIAVLAVPLVYMAQQAGWIVSEVGRQPWVVQDLMPTMAGVTRISTGSVKTTFWLFTVLFTILLIAELKIMFRQIKIGPKK